MWKSLPENLTRGFLSLKVLGSKFDFLLPKNKVTKILNDPYNFKCFGEHIIFFFFIVFIQNSEAFCERIVGCHFSFIHFPLFPFYFNFAPKEQGGLIRPIKRHCFRILLLLGNLLQKCYTTTKKEHAISWRDTQVWLQETFRNTTSQRVRCITSQDYSGQTTVDNRKVPSYYRKNKVIRSSD